MFESTKPGYLTTEFWTTVLTQVLGGVLGVAALFGHNLDGSKYQPLIGLGALLAVGIASAYYAHSRGKVKAATAVAPAAPVVSPMAAGEAGHTSVDLLLLVGTFIVVVILLVLHLGVTGH